MISAQKALRFTFYKAVSKTHFSHTQMIKNIGRLPRSEQQSEWRSAEAGLLLIILKNVTRVK